MNIWAFATIAALALGSGSVSTGVDRDSLDQFNLNKLRGLCTAVSSAEKIPGNQEEYSFVYEKIIFDAARVDFSKDTGATARVKIQTLWRLHPWELRCNANDFNVRSGSVLKYAVATGAYNLVEDAVIRWKVDVNFVDPSNGKTLLDYIDKLIPMYSDTTHGTKLSMYRGILIRNGAIHAQEVPSAELTAQRRAFVRDVRWHIARGGASKSSELEVEEICGKEPEACR